MRVEANKQPPLSRSYHRLFPILMLALLTAVLEFNPRARAQDVPPLGGQEADGEACK